MSTIIKSIGISNSQISETRYHFQAAKVIENPTTIVEKEKKAAKHPFSFEHRPRCARLPDFSPRLVFPPPLPLPVGKGSQQQRG